jgi:hypothetical protein
MSPYHTRCLEEACSWWCHRPGCLEPGVHFLSITERQGNIWVAQHRYDCTLPHSIARQAVEELHAGMDPTEIQIARRVLAEALDRLEELEKKRPAIYRESA